jgi:ribosomal protein S18 acetylase RimI-like enzyme
VDPPRPATAASADELLELFQSIRRELELREEAPSGAWVESSVTEAKAGTRPAWFYAPSEAGGGISFSSRRGPKVWGHVHAAAGPDAAERAERLADALLTSLSAEVRWVSIGFSGFDLDEERRVVRRLADRPGALAVERYQMECALRRERPPELPAPPAGLELLPVRAATVEALGDLDARGFRDTVDDLVMGGTVVEYTEIVQGLLDSRIGRFLDEASHLLYQPEPPRLVGAVLVSEASPREGVILDLVVDPERRGHGYGRFLLRWGLRALFALGYSTATLWVTESNRTALRLYEAEGFRRVASTVLFHWTRPSAEPQPQTSR